MKHTLFSLFNGIIEFVAQNGYNIDFINDIDFALLSRNFRQSADYYTVYQFIAHFASKFRCLKIKKVVIEDNSELKALPSSCFSNCSSLITVDFGKNSKIKTIKSGAFRNCSKLTAIDIPKSVTLIENSAFYNCTSISSVVIPAGVVNIGAKAFYGWTSDQTIYIEGRTEAPWSWNVNWYENSAATVVWGYEQK